jgi:hypothetical protein
MWLISLQTDNKKQNQTAQKALNLSFSSNFNSKAKTEKLLGPENGWYNPT